MNRCFALLALLLSFNTVPAQKNLWVKDSAFVKWIDLPRTIKEKVTAPLIYISSDHDVYRLFGYDTSRAYREFNFGHYHILGKYVCLQCELICRHDEGRQECHRNRCSNAWMWAQRSNEKAFTFIPGMALVTGDKDYRFNDTLVKPSSPADSGKAVWHLSVGGDCHAWHVFKLYEDKFYPAMLLKEFNYYGGCRAGGFWQYEIRFALPERAQYYLQNTILVEKNR